jgi:branched-chain amino acid transport system permease protein
MLHAAVSAMVDGVVLGALVVLIALGHAGIRRLVELIDFAHGRVLVVGAYGGVATCAYLLPTFLHHHWYLALVLLVVAGAVLAVLVAAVMAAQATPIARVARLVPVLLVSMALHEAIRLFCPGIGQVRTSPEIFVANATAIVSWTGLLIVGLCVALAFALRGLGTGDMRPGVLLPALPAVGRRSDLTVPAMLWFAYMTGLVGLAGILYGADSTAVPVDVGYQSGLVTVATAVLGWTSTQRRRARRRY